MVGFETVDSEEYKFGENEFIQLALKKAVSEDGEEEYIALASGTYDEDGEKRVKNNFSLPKDRNALNFIIKTLPTLLD